MTHFISYVIYKPIFLKGRAIWPTPGCLRVKLMFSQNWREYGLELHTHQKTKYTKFCSLIEWLRA